MDFGFSEDEESLREEVRKFLRRELTPELQGELRDWEWHRYPQSYGPHMREFARKLGETGWLGIAWPREYGGLGRPFTELFIIVQELTRHRVVIPNYFAVLMVGPAILHYGSEEQKREFLPKIIKGEIEFALGYTEPQAGSDLASLELRAVEDGDDFILNGQKLFNTACHYADFHWLAARTDTSVPRHRGISVFIVDLKSLGITIRPIQTLGGGRTNEVFYDNVRVPKKNLVGEKNNGWLYMISALNYERIVMSPSGDLEAYFEDLVEYIKKGSPYAKDYLRGSIIRYELAKVAVRLEISRLLGYRAVWMVDTGSVSNSVTATLKAFTHELAQELTNVGMYVLGHYGQLRKGSKWSPLEGEIEEGYRATIIATIGAGTSEIMRNIIAIDGLGLPR